MSCKAEPDPDRPRSYLIFLYDNKTSQRNLFGRLCYQPCGYDNYFYTIFIGQKLYQIRSSDLKDRFLTIVDKLESDNSFANSVPETLFQVLDSFSKLTKTYHITIRDKKSEYGYLAIVVLLYLHECKWKVSGN